MAASKTKHMVVKFQVYKTCQNSTKISESDFASLFQMLYCLHV